MSCSTDAKEAGRPILGQRTLEVVEAYQQPEPVAGGANAPTRTTKECGRINRESSRRLPSSSRDQRDVVSRAELGASTRREDGPEHVARNCGRVGNRQICLDLINGWRPPSADIDSRGGADSSQRLGAWVSLDENLLGDQGGVTVATLNLYVRRDGSWRMVAHHGSVVQVGTQ